MYVIIRPPDYDREVLYFTAELFFASQTLIYQTTDRRPAKMILMINSYVWHEKLTRPPFRQF